MRNKTSKLVLIAAGLVCLHTAPEVASAADNQGAIPPPKVEDNSHAPISILDFKNVTWPEASAPGSTIPIRFSIVNNGAGAAKNIRIRAESQDLEALVPKSVSSVNAKYFAPKQQETYAFTFRLTETAKQKNYPLKLSLSYVDTATGEVHENSQMVTVSSTGGSAPSSNNPAGGDFDPSSIASDLGGGLDMGGGLPAGGPSGGASMGDMPGDLGPALPVTGTGASPEGQAPTGANSPKIIIDSYTLTPEEATAGVPFTLSFRVFNTNRNKSVRNIRVSLSADAAESVSLPTSSEGDAQQAAAALTGGDAAASSGSSAFIPVGSSNALHIEKIKPRHGAEKEITLTTAPDTSPKTYSITATFEYEDGAGTPYTSSEVIGVPVIQDSVLEPGDLKVEKSGSVGEEMPLSFEFFNTGKSVLSNVMVKLRGNFDADTSTYFAGNVAPSSAETYDVNITPTQKGRQKGEIIISYDDATGKKREFVKPFTIDVEDAGAVEDADEENDNARPAWAIPAGLILIAAVAAAIAVYVTKKRKKQAGDDDADLKV
ncbi:MAG: hypothetical protein SPI65_05650 [Peptoniphilus sp.]|nr:hypothetical protein [Peptoniphilus sp.]MDD7362557.1 hypothetical protein [Bacillota bacterium]MDY6045044.1 hypothetical protein [Peptoniphilus sp.]